MAHEGTVLVAVTAAVDCDAAAVGAVGWATATTFIGTCLVKPVRVLVVTIRCAGNGCAPTDARLCISPLSNCMRPMPAVAARWYGLSKMASYDEDAMIGTETSPPLAAFVFGFALRDHLGTPDRACA